MTNEDLNFLRAELSMARQAGVKKMMINTSDLQSLLSRIDAAQDMIDRSDEAKFKRCGFIIGNDLRNLFEGKEMFAKIKRKKSPRHCTQLYFKVIASEDTRDQSSKEMEAKTLS